MYCKPRYGSMLSSEWATSFECCTFNSKMMDKEEFEGCEDARLQYLTNWRDAALLYCPNVGEYSFYIDVISISMPVTVKKLLVGGWLSAAKVAKLNFALVVIVSY